MAESYELNHTAIKTKPTVYTLPCKSIKHYYDSVDKFQQVPLGEMTKHKRDVLKSLRGWLKKKGVEIDVKREFIIFVLRLIKMNLFANNFVEKRRQVIIGACYSGKLNVNRNLKGGNLVVRCIARKYNILCDIFFDDVTCTFCKIALPTRQMLSIKNEHDYRENSAGILFGSAETSDEGIDSSFVISDDAMYLSDDEASEILDDTRSYAQRFKDSISQSKKKVIADITNDAIESIPEAIGNNKEALNESLFDLLEDLITKVKEKAKKATLDTFDFAQSVFNTVQEFISKYLMNNTTFANGTLTEKVFIVLMNCLFGCALGRAYNAIFRSIVYTYYGVDDKPVAFERQSDNILVDDTFSMLAHFGILTVSSAVLLQREFKGVTNTIECARKLFNCVINALGLGQYRILNKIEEAIALCQQANKLMSVGLHVIKTDGAKYDELMAIEEKMRCFDICKLTSNSRSTFTTELNKLSKFNAMLKKPARPRVEPVWINIYGPSGTQKTTVAKEFLFPGFAENLRAAGHPDYTREFDESMIYCHVYKEGGFHASFADQKLFLWDEFLAASQEQEKQAKELIQWCNTAPIHADMPFGNKGKMLLEPDMIITTSNADPHVLHKSGLTSKQAFLNRAIHVEKVYDVGRDEFVMYLIVPQGGYRQDIAKVISDAYPLNTQTIKFRVEISEEELLQITLKIFQIRFDRWKSTRVKNHPKPSIVTKFDFSVDRRVLVSDFGMRFDTLNKAIDHFGMGPGLRSYIDEHNSLPDEIINLLINVSCVNRGNTTYSNAYTSIKGICKQYEPSTYEYYKLCLYPTSFWYESTRNIVLDIGLKLITCGVLLGILAKVINTVWTEKFNYQNYAKKLVKPVAQATGISKLADIFARQAWVTEEECEALHHKNAQRLCDISNASIKVKLYYKKNVGYTHILSLKANYYLANKHVMARKNDPVISMDIMANTIGGPSLKIADYQIRTVYVDDIHDLVIFKIVRGGHPLHRKSMFKYIASDNQSFTKYDYTIRVDPSGIKETNLEIFPSDGKITFQEDDGTINTFIGKFVRYVRKGLPGECCSIYVGFDNTGRAWIKDIHVAGGVSGQSIGVNLNRQLLFDVIEKDIEENKDEQDLLGPRLKLAEPVKRHCKFTTGDSQYTSIPWRQITTLDRTKKLYIENDYKKSLISNIIEKDIPNIVRPTITKKAYWRSKCGEYYVTTTPLAKTIGNYNRLEMVPLPDSYSYLAEDRPNLLYSGWYNNLIKGEYKEDSLEDVIFGNEEKGIPPIKLSSSGGAMFWFLGFTDKSSVIDRERKWIHPRLLAALEEQYEYLKKGVLLTYSVMVLLKIETIDKDDVNIKDFVQIDESDYDHSRHSNHLFDLADLTSKCRAYTGNSFGIQVQSQRLLGDFYRRITRNIGGGHLITFNPHSSQCQLLVETYNQDHGETYTGDIKGLDMARQPGLCILGNRNDMRIMGLRPGTEQWIKVKTIFDSIICNYLFMGNVLYMPLWYYKSGSMFTIYCHCRDMTAAFNHMSLIAYPDLDPIEVIFVTMCGDDWALLVYKGFRLINKITIRDFFKEAYGMTLTNADKTTITCKQQDQDEPFEMVSRTFVYDDDCNQYVARLKKSSIEGMLHWVKSSQPPNEAILQNIDAALLELFYYGRTDFEAYRSVLQNALVKIGINKVLNDYAYYSARFLLKYENCLKNEGIIDYTEAGIQQIYEYQSRWVDEKSYIYSRCEPKHYTGVACRAILCNGKTGADTNNVELKLAAEQTVATPTGNQNTYIELVEGQTDGETTAPSYDPAQLTSIYPLPNQVPVQLADREFLIDQRTFENAGDFTYYPFRRVVSEATEVLNWLRYFVYVKFDIEIRIQLVAPITTYGTIAVFWEPWYDLVRPATYNFQDYSCLNTAYLSVADNEAYTMTIPWTGPFSMGTVLQGTPGANDILRSQGRLVIDNVFDLQRTDELAGQCFFQLYVRMKNVVVQGPTVQTIPTAFKRQMQMVQQPANPIARAVSNTGMLMTGAVGIASSWLGCYFNSIGNSSAKNAADNTLSTLTNIFKEVKGKQMSTRDGGAERESVKQNAFGDLSTPASMSTYQNLGDTPNFLRLSHKQSGDVDGVYDVYKLCRRWATVAVFQMPTSGTGDSTTAILQPVPITGTDELATQKQEDNRGYLPFFARFFRFWRGSIEYKIHVFLPPTVTAKFLITVYWDKGISSAPLAENVVGNYTTMQFTVRGTTCTAFSIPYLQPFPWRSMDNFRPGTGLNDGIGPFVRLEKIDVLPAIDGFIPILIHKRIGPDFRFKSLQSGTPNNTFVPPPPEVFKRQGQLNPLEPEEEDMVKFGSTDLAYDHEAFHGSVYDMMRRHSTRPSDDYLGVPGASIGSNPDNWSSYDVFDQLASMYCFYSGSYRVKSGFKREITADTSLTFTLPNQLTNEDTAPPTNLPEIRTGNGQQVIVPNVFPIAEIEIPFLSELPMWPTHGINGFNFPGGFDITIPTVSSITDGIVDETTLLPEEYASFVQPGDNYGLHILTAPVRYELLPPVTSKSPPFLTKENSHSRVGGF